MPTKPRSRKEIVNREDLEEWLSNNSNLDPAIVLRIALRILPLTYGPEYFVENRQLALSLQTFRAAFIVWAAQEYKLKGVWNAADEAAQAVNIARTPDIEEPSHSSIADAAAYVIARIARVYGRTRGRADGVSVLNLGFDGVSYAIVEADILGRKAFWNSAVTDANWIKSQDPGGLVRSPSRLISERLWIDDVRRDRNFRVNFPDWARGPWDALKKSHAAKEAGFGFWIRWYESLLLGRKTGLFDKALKGKTERDFLVRIAKQPTKFWNRDVAVVNAEIRHWIEDKKTQLRRASEQQPIGETDEHDVDPFTLVQRPSSHRFDRQGNRIEATPVTEPPFDAVLAETIIIELRQKAIEALGSLTDNNADEVVRRAITRLSESLHSSSTEIAEGILLMRANTLSAHRRAYADPGSERERAIRAVLDDLSSSVDSLVDCYPGIRQINANRLALDMQAEQAPEVETAIDEITEIARRSPAVGPSATAALDIGRDDVRDLTEKLERETNLARAADYIATRGQIVASRLLDATNFASATLQSVGNELSGISSDIWKEVRKSLPKAVGTGLSKGTEKALESLVERGPVVALAYLLAGPLAALAVLVPRLKGHAHKADEIKDKVEKKLDSN